MATASTSFLSRNERALGIAVVVVATFFLGLAHGVGYPLTSLTFEAWGAPA